MGLENIELNNDLSPEQMEQHEKFPKLFKIAQRFFSSSENVDESIYVDMKKLEDSIDNPEQYYFWSLLSPRISTNEADYNGKYDDENKIEKFLLKLQKKMDEWEKV